MALNIYRAIQWAIDKANDPACGYSQGGSGHPPRTGPDYDCSSFTAEAMIQGGAEMTVGGVPVTSCGQITTSNLQEALMSVGFSVRPLLQTPMLGDVFVWDGSGSDGHAFMCTSPTQIVEASSDRGHPETGDQTGTEVWVTSFPSDLSSHPWVHLRPAPSAYGQWHCKASGGYDMTDQFAIDNAFMIWSILSNLGWTVEAVCGFMGNVQIESGVNPWRYQYDSIQSRSSALTWGGGYGLVQFTPCRKYQQDSRSMAMTGYGPNYSDQTGSNDDGTAQLRFIDQYADYEPDLPSYPMTYAEYKASTLSADYLAEVWFYNYERGDPTSLQQRKDAALYWYSVLQGTPPGPGPVGNVPYWLLKKIHDRNFGRGA